MKLFEIPMVVTSLVSLGFFAGLDAPPARADFTFGEPVNVLSTFPSLGTAAECIDCFSADGLEAYMESNRSGSWDLWVYKRASVEDNWGPPENLGPVNKPAWDAWSSITGDGLELYFGSGRNGGYGGGDIWVTKRATRDSPWEQPHVVANVNTSSMDSCSSVSSDGLELYFMSQRPGGCGGMDLYVSKRATRNDPWGPAENLGPAVNGPGDETAPSLSPDGLLLAFEDYGGARPDGYGGGDLWMTRRASRSAPWQPPVNLGPIINRPTWDERPWFAPDGSALYFLREDIALWKAPILPTVDFNGDGKVDEKDLALLMADWGKSNSVCDIGPYPWGDGVVDEKDLSALLEEMTGTGFVRSPLAQTSEIPCDTSLTWAAVPFAASYDVYFGTSFEAVNNASRADPCGVLVSQGQTATTYDPELDYAKTYYWRVDFVSAGPAPTVYRGCVLDFTTAVFAYPIKNIIATASSATNGPEKTIDGSGLNENDGHSTNVGDMWLSGTTSPHWIQFEFDKVYALHELWVWNYNQQIEPLVGFGAKSVKIGYSTDGTTWTALADVPEFTQAPGQAGYMANTVVSFGGVSAKYVKLTIEKAWGPAPTVGLSEVRFFYIPDRP